MAARTRTRRVARAAAPEPSAAQRRLSGVTDKALECKDRAYGHQWPRKKQTKYRRELSRTTVGEWTYVVEEITCIWCGLKAKDEWKYDDHDERRYRDGDGTRGYKYLDGFRVARPEPGESRERITSADIGYELMRRRHPGLG